MTFENLQVDIEDRIAIVRIDRPKKLNALNRETIEELHQAFKALLSNEDADVVILTGSGEKAFVAGADISEFSEYSVELDVLLIFSKLLKISFIPPSLSAIAESNTPLSKMLLLLEFVIFLKL